MQGVSGDTAESPKKTVSGYSLGNGNIVAVAQELEGQHPVKTLHLNDHDVCDCQWVCPATSFKTTPETLANCHHNETETLRHHVMLNDCVGARWSPVCQYSLLTLLEESPFVYKAQSWVNKALDIKRWLFFSLPYFGFRTSAFFTCPHHIPLHQKPLQ